MSTEFWGRVEEGRGYLVFFIKFFWGLVRIFSKEREGVVVKRREALCV